jgi:hypothetical protein
MATAKGILVVAFMDTGFVPPSFMTSENSEFIQMQGTKNFSPG